VICPRKICYSFDRYEMITELSREINRREKKEDFFSARKKNVCVIVSKTLDNKKNRKKKPTKVDAANL